jgi:hypothetical protein
MKISSLSSSGSFYMGSKSMWGSSSLNPMLQKPFSQQFDFQLSDIPIRRRKQSFVPVGVVIVFFPGIPDFEVTYRDRQPVEELREAIEEKIRVSIKDYYVVCDKGIIPDGSTLDDYRIEPNSCIVLIEKGKKISERSLAMKQWIENRKYRRNNPSAKLVFPVQPVPKPKPKRVNRKIREKTSIDEIDTFLRSVKIENLL